MWKTLYSRLVEKALYGLNKTVQIMAEKKKHKSVTMDHGNFFLQ